MKAIYLDNAATTQVREEVIVKMQDALANSYGNPSSTHSFGRTAKTAIESARKTIAKYFLSHRHNYKLIELGAFLKSCLLMN